MSDTPHTTDLLPNETSTSSSTEDVQIPRPGAEAESAATSAEQGKLAKYMKRFGVAGFLFFFIKGLLWLLIPLLIALGWFGGK